MSDELENLVKQAFETHGFEHTNGTKKLLRFDSRSTGQFVYFARERDAAKPLQVVIHPHLDPEVYLSLVGVTTHHPFKFRLHSNQTRFPKIQGKGKKPIHYGIPLFMDSLASLNAFLQAFQQSFCARRGNPPTGLPEELSEGTTYHEGDVQRVLINRYERDIRARGECIRYYGPICSICRFDFADFYGPDAEGLIHVHHLRPLSTVGEGYQVDPIEDLCPVCPNCHAVIHIRQPPYLPEEVRRFLRRHEGTRDLP